MAISPKDLGKKSKHLINTLEAEIDNELRKLPAVETGNTASFYLLKWLDKNEIKLLRSSLVESQLSLRYEKRGWRKLRISFWYYPPILGFLLCWVDEKKWVKVSIELYK